MIGSGGKLLLTARPAPLMVSGVITLLSVGSGLRQAPIDTSVISMNPTQSRMARAALKWSLSDLADAAGVGRATAARFELGETVAPASVAAMRSACEAAGVSFVETGRHAGAVKPN